MEEVGGGAIGETHDKGEEAPRAEVSDLVSDLPTVVQMLRGRLPERCQVERGSHPRLDGQGWPHQL